MVQAVPCKDGNTQKVHVDHISEYRICWWTGPSQGKSFPHWKKDHWCIGSSIGGPTMHFNLEVFNACDIIKYHWELKNNYTVRWLY